MLLGLETYKEFSNYAQQLLLGAIHVSASRKLFVRFGTYTIFSAIFVYPIIHNGKSRAVLCSLRFTTKLNFGDVDDYVDPLVCCCVYAVILRSKSNILFALN